VSTLEPYQREIEHHFTVEGQRRFRGLMGGYLHLVTRMRYLGGSLRDRVPFLPKARERVDRPAAWDVQMFSRACSDVAANRTLDAHAKDLANKLLIEADARGFTLSLLAEPVESAAKIDWRQRYAGALSEVLHEVEKQRSQPTGARRYVQAALGFLADWAPPAALVATLVVLLLKWYNAFNVSPPPTLGWSDFLSPVYVTLIVLVILHVLIALLLPVRWSAIRGEFRQRLEARLSKELEDVYGPVPADVAAALAAERRQVGKLAAETREVASWLRQREQSASVSGLYGH
jgi:hypothetical protein